MMADPIHGVSIIDAALVTSAAQPENAPAAGKTEEANLSTPIDSADVARAEALLATIAQAAAAVPPLDPARVAELKQAVNSGIYEANPQQISAKIIEIEALLAAKKQG